MRQAVAELAVVDFGGQYTHLIARTLRELGVRASLHSVEELRAGSLAEAAGLVLSGGPASVTQTDLVELAQVLRRCRVPLLGICFGHQLIAAVFGGTVTQTGSREYGQATLEADSQAALFRGLPRTQRVWMSHGDCVETLPPGFIPTASTPSLPIAAFQSADGMIHGVQFHPEVVHTEHGRAILANFVSLCASRVPGGLATFAWSASQAREEALERIRSQAGDRTLVLLVSGGVDSTVALALCHEAVGPSRVRAIHVDTGFMRRGESAQIVQTLAEAGYPEVTLVDASAEFFSALQAVVDPEEKRTIIGRLFVETFHRALGQLGVGEDWILVQGTIYPDRIETACSARADRIKTHHNRVKEIEALASQHRVLEPLADLYKHEVRQLGEALGLPKSLLARHPFPGPGLAIRVVCSRGTPPEGFQDRCPPVEALAAEEGCEARILPVRSVGVQGDGRTYRCPVVLWRRGGGPPVWPRAKELASRIVNSVPTVNRAVWAFRDPTHLSLGPCFLTRQTIALLQEVDEAARHAVAGVEAIWQMPVVALPLFDPQGRQAFVVRPVESRDAMTADVHQMEQPLLARLTEAVERIPGVGCLFYDLTTKPPGTIEWE